MEENGGITLSELFQSLLKRWYIMFITILLGLITTGILAFSVITPKYKSFVEVVISVKDENNKLDSNETHRVSDTIASFFTQNLVLEHAIEELGLESINSSMIKSGLTVKHTTTNFFMEISFVYTDPEIAKTIVQQVVDSTQYLANTNEEIGLQNTITITNPAQKGYYVSPNKTLYLIVGLLIGGVIGAAIIFILEFASNTYKRKDEIEFDLKMQVIGVIPEYTATSKDIAKTQDEENNKEID